MKRIAILLFACAANVGAQDFSTKLQPVLKTYCLDCHNEKKQEGELNLARFGTESAVLAERKVWRRVWEMQHNRDDLPLLLAGGGNGMIRGGRHLRYRGEAFADLHLAMLRNAGAKVERTADSSAPLRCLA